MKALGNYAVIKLENSTSKSGIQVRIDSTGIVHSCPSMPEIEGKLVLFDDRHRFVTHEDMIIVSVEHLLGVFD